MTLSKAKPHVWRYFDFEMKIFFNLLVITCNISLSVITDLPQSTGKNTLEKTRTEFFLIEISEEVLGNDTRHSDEYIYSHIRFFFTVQ